MQSMNVFAMSFRTRHPITYSSLSSFPLKNPMSFFCSCFNRVLLSHLPEASAVPHVPINLMHLILQFFYSYIIMFQVLTMILLLPRIFEAWVAPVATFHLRPGIWNPWSLLTRATAFLAWSLRYYLSSLCVSLAILNLAEPIPL